MLVIVEGLVFRAEDFQSAECEEIAQRCGVWRVRVRLVASEAIETTFPKEADARQALAAIHDQVSHTLSNGLRRKSDEFIGDMTRRLMHVMLRPISDSNKREYMIQILSEVLELPEDTLKNACSESSE